MVMNRLVVSLLWLNGHIVQSVGFQHTNVVGDPKVAIEFFNAWDADEIVLIDVSRQSTQRRKFIQTLDYVCKHCFLPLTVGGWVDSHESALQLLRSGGDKIIVNTAGFDNPQFFRELADDFGQQCVVAGLDVRRDDTLGYRAYVDRGRRATQLSAPDAARLAVDSGAGEILLTSIDQDGSLAGYDLDLIRAVSDAVSVPVVAFGGVGSWDHLVDGIKAGAQAVSAGNIYHFTEQSTRKAKHAMKAAGLPVR